ncbi:hypothetical protein PYCC9005_003795 [Savitreella phatthalungensis]
MGDSHTPSTTNATTSGHSLQTGSSSRITSIPGAKPTKAWTIATSDSSQANRHQAAIVAAHRALHGKRPSLVFSPSSLSSTASEDEAPCTADSDSAFSSESEDYSISKADSQVIRAQKTHPGKRVRPRRVTFGSSSHRPDMSVSHGDKSPRDNSQEDPASPPKLTVDLSGLALFPADSTDSALKSESVDTAYRKTDSPRRERRHTSAVINRVSLTPPVDEADLGVFKLDQRNGPLHRIREEEDRMRRESESAARPTVDDLTRAHGRRSRACSISSQISLNSTSGETSTSIHRPSFGGRGSHGRSQSYSFGWGAPGLSPSMLPAGTPALSSTGTFTGPSSPATVAASSPHTFTSNWLSQTHKEREAHANGGSSFSAGWWWSPMTPSSLSPRASHYFADRTLHGSGASTDHSTMSRFSSADISGQSTGVSIVSQADVAGEPLQKVSLQTCNE